MDIDAMHRWLTLNVLQGERSVLGEVAATVGIADSTGRRPPWIKQIKALAISPVPWLKACSCVSPIMGVALQVCGDQQTAPGLICLGQCPG